MTGSPNRRVVVALAVWGALTGIGMLVFPGATPSQAHTCASVKVWAGSSSTSLPACTIHQPPENGSVCGNPPLSVGSVGAQVAYCVHVPAED